MKTPEQSLERWARTEDFPVPPSWGEIESVILAEPIGQDELDQAARTAGPGARILGGLVRLLVGVLAAVMYLSSLIGLAIVLVRAGEGDVLAEPAWVQVARIAFGLAVAVSGTTLGIWFDTRRRGVLGPIATAITGLACLAAVGVMVARPEALGDVVALVLAGLAALLGLVACLVLLLASKPGVARRPMFTRTTVTPQEQIQRGMRAQVLEILVRRGVVSEKEIDIPDMVELPIGSWHELDPPRDARL
ncbi:hypothetical protein LQF12_01785 [Ruania suaedae]|uniref:hypothetical protein n=1 Tax=Ruania suaedae TaxID=2897774 RepID=UPI001E5FFB4D|nr:hypothetical protein [Ruania suaedae]UFU03368.1 hypothetical protein LQF12_01785 [Ruania suaedae]